MPATKLDHKQQTFTIANRIKIIRETKRITQIDLAKAADMSQATLSLLEMGKIKVTLENVMSLAGALGCSVDYLLGREKAATGSTTEQMLMSFERLNPVSQALAVRIVNLMLE